MQLGRANPAVMDTVMKYAKKDKEFELPKMRRMQQMRNYSYSSLPNEGVLSQDDFTASSFHAPMIVDGVSDDEV
jgi:hypothetical protein